MRWTNWVIAAAVVALAGFGLRDFTGRLEAAAVTADPTALPLVIEPLTARLQDTTDARPLIRTGHHLLQAGEPVLASLVLRRATSLAPDSPQAARYLAWGLLAQLDGQPVSDADRRTLINEAAAALDRASTLNPLSPDLPALRAALATTQTAARGGAQ